MRRSIIPTGCALGIVLLAGAPARPGVTVDFDAATLNELLPALTLDEIAVPISEDHAINVLLEELKVTGFQPATGDGGGGRIRTSLRLRVPQLGLSVSVEPTLSLHVVRAAGGDTLELRFERAELRLPLGGKVDVAGLLDPLVFPAENFFLIEGARGNVEVRSRLASVDVGQERIRLEFDLEATQGR